MSRQIGVNNSELTKNSANDNFFEISPCQPERTPYNAPPLTRHNGLRNAVFRRLRQLSRRMKSLKKRG
ncbi:hypothetical protein B2J69_07755 [Pantoea latae]|uniref:Uncharacterized protein n=1 Tax=Pantoea latae TaxID=1964541 RepID=A0A1V9DLZ3_9GAMM|nr:hypothetical protein B2J69_07755 [Pantoea latae]